MSRKLSIHKVIRYEIGNSIPGRLAYLLPKMREIYDNLFDNKQGFDFLNSVKSRGDSVSLGLFYGKHMELAGFTIAGVQRLHIGKETYASFSAGIYSDLRYDLSRELVKFALMKALKYKLSHPTHCLGYLAEALTPAPYSLAVQALPECYPNPHLETPDYVLSIMRAFSKKRGYYGSHDSEYIVSASPKIITKNPKHILSSSKRAHCEYYQYYLSLNPEFQTGNALLIYMPLSLRNIMLGLKNLITGQLRK